VLWGKSCDGLVKKWERTGPFRFFLKNVVLHAALDYARKTRRRNLEREVQALIDLADTRPASLDQPWEREWRESVLQQVRARLDREKTLTSQVGRLLLDDPEMTGTALADELARTSGRSEPFTLDAVFKLKERARAALANHFAEVVRETLANPDEEEVSRELAALGLGSHVCGVRTKGEAP